MDCHARELVGENRDHLRTRWLNDKSDGRQVRRFGRSSPRPGVLPVLARVDAESSWQRFLTALDSDVNDVQGGTTKEGIHMGVMSGTLDLVQRYFVGTTIRNNTLYFSPSQIDRLDGLVLALQFRGTPLRVSIDGSHLTVRAMPERFRGPVKVAVGEDVCRLGAGDSYTFQLSRQWIPDTKSATED